MHVTRKQRVVQLTLRSSFDINKFHYKIVHVIPLNTFEVECVVTQKLLALEPYALKTLLILYKLTNTNIALRLGILSKTTRVPVLRSSNFVKCLMFTPLLSRKISIFCTRWSFRCKIRNTLYKNKHTFSQGILVMDKTLHITTCK